ncbi:10667_t:CDS:2 [Paraglomus occultum]|uniref:10667_t:CDS:1 n=1 Tax=Paraglomus occultum TaxID=144539 RepID=A0A9N9G357_9GLOM|nr:10667_t:CDS:2 [Paraglomus occultum]
MIARWKRFLGIMEKTREAFETDEIPFHRIRYFKSMATNEIIWDRKKRIDLITRSYKGPLSAESAPSPSPTLSETTAEEPSSQETSPPTTRRKTPYPEPAAQPVFSTRSKKEYIKRRRAKTQKKMIEAARLELAEEERVKREHDMMLEDKLREVQERIEKFNSMKAFLENTQSVSTN